MEKPIIVELRDPFGQLRERRQLSNGSILIGRGFDAGLAVDDEFVCPHHCRLELRPDGIWHLVDLESVNGIRLATDNRRRSDILPSHGSRVHLGHCELRFYDPALAMPPAKPLRHTLHFGPSARRREISRASLALFATFGVCALSWAASYSDEEYGPLEHAVFTFFAALLLLLPWSGFWALLSRIGHRHSFFLRHLAIAGWAFSAVSLAALGFDLIVANFNATALASLGSTGIYGVAFLIALLAHLRFASHQSDRARVVTAMIVSAVCIACTVLVQWRVAQTYTANAPLDDPLVPPSLLFTPDESSEQVGQNIERITQQLEHEHVR